jgi:hypothetical protein
MLVGTALAESAVDSPVYDSSVNMTLITPLSSPVVDSCLPLIVRQFDDCRQLSSPTSGELSDGVNYQQSTTMPNGKTEEPEDNQETGDNRTHQNVVDTDGEANTQAASPRCQHGRSFHRCHMRDSREIANILSIKINKRHMRTYYLPMLPCLLSLKELRLA